jgi:hypothetical protein
MGPFWAIVQLRCSAGPLRQLINAAFATMLILNNMEMEEQTDFQSRTFFLIGDLTE